jgi:dienelactone hydrolase
MAALDFLAKRPNVNAAKVGCTGSMGGRLTFLAAERPERIAAAAPFYGGGISGLLDRRRRSARRSTCSSASATRSSPRPGEADRRQAEGARQGAHHQGVQRLGPRLFCDDRGSYDAKSAADAWSSSAFFKKPGS